MDCSHISVSKVEYLSFEINSSTSAYIVSHSHITLYVGKQAYSRGTRFVAESSKLPGGVSRIRGIHWLLNWSKIQDRAEN